MGAIEKAMTEAAMANAAAPVPERVLDGAELTGLLVPSMVMYLWAKWPTFALAKRLIPNQWA